MKAPIPASLSALVIATSLSLLGTVANAQTISVAVPVLPGSESGSRAATFRWEVKSANGATARFGQYACGSYWVAPADGDTGVTVVSLSATSGGVAQASHISLDADPITEKRGLLNNSNNYGNFDAAEALQALLPRVFTAPVGSCISLVAALQRNEAESPGGGTPAITGERVDAYSILTVLRSPPPNDGLNSLRPNITGASKEMLTWDDFDLSKLGRFDQFPSISQSALEEIRTRWRHSTEIFGYDVVRNGTTRGFSEAGRAFRASLLHDEYGAGMSATLQNDILALFNTGNTIDEKRPALASMLAFALDLYHARYNFGTAEPKAFTSGAGQHAGKYAPLLLLAALSKDQSKASQLRELSITNQHPSQIGARGPQEIRQIRRGVTGVVLWGDSFPYTFSSTTAMPNGSPSRRYWNDLVWSRNYRGQEPYGNPNTGQKTASDPYGYIDGPPNYPGYAYMPIGAVATQGLSAIMILMPSIRDIVNSDLPIEFADRFSRHGTWASPDPIAPPPRDVNENIWNPGVFPGDTFGRTWGPSPSDVRFGIEDGSGLGRFNAADMHGKILYSSYLPELVRTHWSSIISIYDGERFEDNFVPLTGTAKPDIIIFNGLAHISHPHPLATIFYTIDGTTPGVGSAVYTSPVSVGTSTSVRAMATTPGKTPSTVRTYGVRSRADAPPSNARILVN